MDLPDGVSLRDVRDDDAPALTALIGSIYAEYPGCVLDLEGVDADLTTPASYIERRGGAWWLVTGDGGDLLASCGWTPSVLDGEPAIELKRLYVARAARGRGLATRLVWAVESVGRDRGSDWVHAWSDSRFLHAHRLYERLGYLRRPETRDLDDPSGTTEFHFVRPLAG